MTSDDDERRASLRDMQPRGMIFDGFYENAARAPWDIGRPQPALVATADQWRGRVLDVGCGTGEHALFAASRGLEAWGVDAAAGAIDGANEKAKGRGLAARFVVGDACTIDALGVSFDTVVDCGFFHVLDDIDRARWKTALDRIVPAGGRYFVLAMSEKQPGDVGPRRVTEAELREWFGDGWRIDAIDDAAFESTLAPEPLAARRACMTRV